MDGFFKLSEIQSERPTGSIPKCGACGLYLKCNSPKMKPYGHGGKEVLIVGEAPGQREDEEGRPFVGKSGKLLRQTLSGLGVTLDKDCVVTNSLICRPPNNAAPEAKQISWCRPNLLKTIGSVQPRIVITLGQAALRAVVQEYWKGDIGKMEKWVGWQIPTPKFWLCPTYHPSYVLRREKDRMLERVWTDHLESAFAIEGSTPPTPDYRSQVECFTDDLDAAKAIRWFIKRGGWSAFDYEGNCLKPEYPKAELVSCSISNGERTIAYPWWGSAIEATSEYIRSERTRKIASNIKHEIRWTKVKLGHWVRNPDWDTMIAAHVIDNRPGICSLKFQSFIHLGVQSYNENVEPYLKEHRGHYNRIREIALPTLLTYNGLDSLLEYWLAMKQMEALGYEN